MGRKRRGSGSRPMRQHRQPGLMGTVRVRERDGFVETAEGTYKLTGRGLRDAMPGDKVFVSLARGSNGQRRAVIEHVVEHAVSSIVGTFEQMGPLGAVRSLDTRIHADFFVLPSDDSPTRFKVAPGDMVAARIVSYPNHVESGVVTITRRIGEADAPELGIECVMARYGLEDAYPARALQEAEALSLDIERELSDPLRKDIRDRFLLTVDPVDARDFDDAISLERTRAGGWKLGVHIADVSHYVAWESAIDLEARRRSTSVYLADRVLPMLPERLSNDLCSLRPDEERLAFTVDMVLDERGRVRGYTAYPSIIESKARLDYAAVDALLEGREPSENDDAAVRAAAAVERAGERGVDLEAFFRDADALARARQRIRHARGAIDFETVEVHALLDDDGYPIELVGRRRTRATSLIEEAMLLANECVAEYLADRDLDAAFRVHEPPSPDSLAGAARVLVEVGAIDANEALSIEEGDPHAIERAVEQVSGTGYEPLANALLLRAMQRALYKPKNEGHYALGARAYCHFTSPIRRYPDLIVHRVLKMALALDRLGKRAAAPYRAALMGKGPQALDRILPQLCRNAGERERLADAASTASQKVKIAQYYSDRIGERYSGAVSWIDQMGVFVRLDDTGAEGLVRLKGLGGEWWDLDERSLKLTGSSTGRTIEMGDRMVVEVAGADVVRGHLDFTLVHVGPAPA